jgi:Recombinase
MRVFTLREAARTIGVSPGRLYRAIGAGRLRVDAGGGPGKNTLISEDALHAFAASEGLSLSDAGAIRERAERSGRSEHAERSIDMPQELETLAGQYLARIMDRQSNYFDLFLKEELSHLVERVVERVVDQVTERLTERFSVSPTIHHERLERPERAERSRPSIAAPKDAVLKRLRDMQAEGLSLQKIADRLNADGVPTLSGKGRWQKGTIGNLLAERNEIP